MNEKTAQALRAIDRTFYEECAEAFAATRSWPWSGFSRILTHARESLRVLDLGCGNARFAQTLSEQATVESYLGIDQSAPLLTRAKALDLPFPAEFHQGDLLDQHFVWPGGRFSLPGF